MTSRRSHAAPQMRLLLRVHSARGLEHSASSGVYCKLYLGDTAMTNGSQRGLFGRRSRPSSGGDEDSETHRIFRTRTLTHADHVLPAVWDEHFDVLVVDAQAEILSVRVKCQHRICPSVLGVCAIPLKKLKPGRMVDKWFTLQKDQKDVGASIRLQFVLTDLDPQASRTRGVLQADIKTALAANHAADEAIDRLLAVAALKREASDASFTSTNSQGDSPTARASAPKSNETLPLAGDNNAVYRV